MDISEQVDTLERRELDNGPDGLTVQGYTELLAYYLLSGSLPNAKYLWKRVPTTMKSSSPELEAVWAVGRRLWVKDMPGFYQAIAAYQWSSSISPIITKLAESVREKMVRLIGTAYQSIRPGDVGTMLGLSNEQVESLVGERGWKVNNGMIEPVEVPEEETPFCSGEDQIGKLTDYVAFLEN